MSAEIPNYEVLSARIAKLEKENRTIKRAALALLVLPVAFLVMAQAPAPAQAPVPAQPSAPATRVVVANEFILKDASGHTRARLWFGPKPTKSPATASLTFYDSNGDRDLASLTVDGAAHSANLNLGGLITGSPSLALSADVKGSYAAFEAAGKLRGVQLSAESEASRISLSGMGDPLKRGVSLTDGAEGGELHVNDAQGDASVSISTKGKAGMSVQDREGRSVLLAGDHLSFGDPQNNFPVVLYAGKDGPFLNLQDAQAFNIQLGVSKTIAKTTGKRLTSTAASLRMFNDKGDLLWSAP